MNDMGMRWGGAGGRGRLMIEAEQRVIQLGRAYLPTQCIDLTGNGGAMGASRRPCWERENEEGDHLIVSLLGLLQPR